MQFVAKSGYTNCIEYQIKHEIKPMPESIQGICERLVSDVKSICPAPEAEYQKLYLDLVEIFKKHNKPVEEVLTEEQKAAFKSEMENVLNTFKNQYQRFFVYHDPFGF